MSDNQNVQEAALQAIVAAAPVPAAAPFPAAPVPARPARARPRARRPNWSPQEKELLLDMIEEVMPQGLAEWQEVERLYLETWTMMTQEVSRRDLVSMKAVFKRLCSTSVPTGDPHCPAPVRRAKRLYHEIVALAGAVGGRNVRQRVLADPAFRNDAEEEANVLEGNGEDDEAAAAAGAARQPNIQRNRRNHRGMNEFERDFLERMDRREEQMNLNIQMLGNLGNMANNPFHNHFDDLNTTIQRMVVGMEGITKRLDRIEGQNRVEEEQDDEIPPLVRRGESESDYNDDSDGDHMSAEASD